MALTRLDHCVFYIFFCRGFLFKGAHAFEMKTILFSELVSSTDSTGDCSFMASAWPFLRQAFVFWRLGGCGTKLDYVRTQ